MTDKFIWSAAEQLPWYHTTDDLLSVGWRTLADHNNPRINSKHHASSDTRELFLKNLKTQPKDWHYRNKVIEYNINSKGYRAPEFSTVDWKNSIAIFGCSMVTGIGVAEDETISHYLQELSGRPVINLGVPASGLDFAVMNNFLLKKNYPTPWAVVNIFSNINRIFEFREKDLYFHGLWSQDENLWTGYIKNLHNPIVTSIMNSEIIKHFWKDTKTFYASWFDDTAHYTECSVLPFTNSARDLVHCGKDDNKSNAEFIWQHLKNTTS